MTKYRKTPLIPFPIGSSQEEFDQLQKELMEQTDRGAAVLGGSFLEWRVKQAIRVRLRVWDANAEMIFGTDEKPGELGFAYQCRMAYCLGLIGPKGLKDLETIAKVRNRFAHHLSVTSFEDRRISDYCKALRTPELWYDLCQLESTKPAEQPRLRYITSVQVLHSMIWAVAAQASVVWPKVNPGTGFW